MVSTGAISATSVNAANSGSDNVTIVYLALGTLFFVFLVVIECIRCIGNNSAPHPSNNGRIQNQEQPVMMPRVMACFSEKGNTQVPVPVLEADIDSFLGTRSGGNHAFHDA